MRSISQTTTTTTTTMTMKQQVGENNRGISGHMFTLHQRLYHALNLGLRSRINGGWKWKCTDIEIQRLVVRSIDAFLDCISGETSQHPLVKDSVRDIVNALESTLLFKNESVLKLASKVAVKFVNDLPNLVIEAHVVDLVHPLSASLSSHQLEVAISCATALSLIISRLSAKREREVWEILKESSAVDKIICNIHDFTSVPNSTEFRQSMIFLLSKILWRWPCSRFCIWNDVKLLAAINSISLETDFSVKIAILQLYSAIALCGNGARKLLENGGMLLQLMVNCMDTSIPYNVQMEGFRLAGCFAISEQGRSRIAKMHCENLIKAIVRGLNNWSLQSGKLGKDQMSLLVEACRLAKITCWAGEHHNYFWKLGIESVLLNLLLGNFHITQQSEKFSSPKEQIAIVRDGLSANFLFVLRPYIWDILGGLAAHGVEDLGTKMLGNEFHLNILITCACLAFADSLRTTRQICQIDIATAYGNESASRSVLLMIYSPCKYIASQVKCVLSEILKPNAKEDISYLLNTLNAASSGGKDRMLNNLQMVVALISLACYSGLPQYWRYITNNQGIKVLSSFISWWLRNPVHVKRSNVSPHFHSHLHKTCCYDCEEDWEGKDMLLLFGLWGLAELIRHSGLGKDHKEIFSSQIEAQLITELQEICINSYASGPRWYAAYLLSYFGFYGFPTKLGRRVGKALDDKKEQTTLTLTLANQEYLSVHGIMIKIRCPSLLPSGEVPLDGSLRSKDVEMKDGPKTEVRLSAHVDHQALLKLLEYIYSGCLQASEEDLVKKLKIFAKHCKLQPLLQVLYRRSPKWGIPMPSFELTSALGPAGYYFSDIILEAKANKLAHWTCNLCSQSAPHLHVHKVILCLSCDYLQALFQSGMQESQSKAIKVDVGWEALVKLINWFYSGDLPKPVFGCLWENLNAEEKLHEVEPYIELYCLTECWLLEDLHEECSRVIISCLNSARHLSIKMIKLAADCFQWDLAEIAASYMAPLYQSLRSSGELEMLDDGLVEMVRIASVRLSQEGGHQYS